MYIDNITQYFLIASKNVKKIQEKYRKMSKIMLILFYK